VKDELIIEILEMQILRYDIHEMEFIIYIKIHVFKIAQLDIIVIIINVFNEILYVKLDNLIITIVHLDLIQNYGFKISLLV